MTVGGRRATKAALSVVLMVALAIALVPTPVAGTTGTLTITTDTTLTEDHNGNIVIAADGITLDCAGYNVTGSGTEPGTVGIYLSGRTGVVVKNCQVKEFAVGFFLEGSSGNTLEGNIARNSAQGGHIPGEGVAAGFSLQPLLDERNMIQLSSDNNNLVSNTAIDNAAGFFLLVASGNTLTGNTASNNTGANNTGVGFLLFGGATNNLVNNRASGNDNGFFLLSSDGNTIFHNNIIDNNVQAGDDNPPLNDWHHPVLEEGNFWSDYTGADDGSGTGKHAIAGDGIGDQDIPWPGPGYDNFPFVNESGWVTAPSAPLSLQATAGDAKVDLTWSAPSDDGDAPITDYRIYRGTASGSVSFLVEVGNVLTYTDLSLTNGVTYYYEVSAVNAVGEGPRSNGASATPNTAPSDAQVGVKAGDRIKYAFEISGAPSGLPLPTSIELEFLSVQGTNATLRLTATFPNGTAESNNVTVNIVTGEPTARPSDGFSVSVSGLVVPADLTTGDSVSVAGLGNATIEGETTRVYAGASRTVVHTTFSQLGTDLTYYWDKQTGVMVEASSVTGSVTATLKAVETNMWAPDTPLFLQIWFLAIVAGAIIAVVGAVYFLRRRRPPQQ